MLNVLGAEYITQHIIQTLKKEAEQKRVQNYIMDALYAISNNKRLEKRFVELYPDFAGRPVNEKRSADEIVNQIKAKLANLGG